MLKFLYLFICFATLGCAQAQHSKLTPDFKSLKEKHFFNAQQVTQNGRNARPRWSPDDDWLTFQHRSLDLLDKGSPCDQIYKVRKDGKELLRLSQGKGQAIDASYLPNGKRVLFSSTIATQLDCPQTKITQNSVWPILDSYQIYGVLPDGNDPIVLEPGAQRAYNAETALCQNGSVIFTSDRSGDLELFSAKLDSFGTFQDVKQVTQIPGYDGGASFSRDCKKVVWFASRPKKGKETVKYQKLLAQHQVDLSQVEIWTALADGSEAHPVTHFGATSIAPVFTPDGKKIVFTSNLKNPKTRRFGLFMMDLDGSHLEQVTSSDSIDSFAAFSNDGKYLAFTSNRNAKSTDEENIFISEWIAKPE